MYLVWLSSLLLALSLLDFLQDTQTLVLDDHPAEGGGEVEDPFNANNFEVSTIT